MLRIISVVLLLSALAISTPIDINSIGNQLADLEKRQSLTDLLNFRAKIYKTEKLKPLIRPEATRERIWFGPFTLPVQDATKAPGPKKPMQMDPNSVQLNKQLSGFCTNCTVLYGKSKLMYQDGSEASVLTGVYTHHVVMVDMSKNTMPFYLCQGQKGFLGTFPAAGFIVSGNDEAANYFTTPDGKFDSGYAIGAKPSVTMQAELINYKPTPQTIYITAEIEYVKGHPAEYDSTVSLFSVTGCEFPDYHVAKDKPQYSLLSALVPMPVDGDIINAKGHLHDGGVNVQLTLNNKTVCDSRAEYGIDSKATKDLAPNGQKWEVITKMSQCTEPIPVKKGDMLQMISIYDNALHPPRHSGAGAMAMDSDEMGVFFINFAAKNSAIEELKKERAKAKEEHDAAKKAEQLKGKSAGSRMR